MYNTITSLDPSKVLNTNDYVELRKRYMDIFKSHQKVVKYIWDTQGLGKKEHNHPHKEYLKNLIHETGMFASMTVSRLNNMDFYRKSRDAVVFEDIGKEMYHNFMMFLIMCQSLYVYYTYNIGEGYLVKYQPKEA